MTPRKAIREKCLDCCSGSSKVVKYCSADGVHSRRCPLWPERFGTRPQSAAKRYGSQFLNPKGMPLPNTPIEELA
jgi:hypothetical protein